MRSRRLPRAVMHVPCHHVRWHARAARTCTRPGMAALLAEPPAAPPRALLLSCLAAHLPRPTRVAPLAPPHFLLLCLCSRRKAISDVPRRSRSSSVTPPALDRGGCHAPSAALTTAAQPAAPRIEFHVSVVFLGRAALQPRQPIDQSIDNATRSSASPVGECCYARFQTRLASAHVARLCGVTNKSHVKTHTQTNTQQNTADDSVRHRSAAAGAAHCMGSGAGFMHWST